MVKQSLVAFDTRHIKQYVFATDKLKEIRGASALLDYLNRHAMEDAAQELGAEAKKVYANGGAALFLVEGDKEVARQFGQRVQQQYSKETFDGASVTFAVQEIPEGVANIWEDNIQETLDLLYARLEMKSSREECIFDLPSHPLMRTCDSCGVRYAETKDDSERRDAGSRDNRYCWTCQQKRKEDGIVKDGIDDITAHIVEYRKRVSQGAQGEIILPDTKEIRHSVAWRKLLCGLPETYDIPENTERPSDFNELRGITGGKDYFAVIYADGNGMGTVMQDQCSLKARKEKAALIDGAVYAALRTAVTDHLPVVEQNNHSMFPFDLLLVGGDDILIVTPADVALDVAITIAKTFREVTVEGDPEHKGYTLSVSVILAPIKYPFRLLMDLAEDALKFAKRADMPRTEKPADERNVEAEKRPAEKSAKVETRAPDKSFINFMVVTGSTSQKFKKVYDSLHDEHGRVSGRKEEVAFYATLRPYTVEELSDLLDAIRKGKSLGLGRTKLHQVREAVLKMNLASSVMDGLAVLRNWRPKQREFVVEQVYTLSKRYQKQDENRPETFFPRVTFPWSADGPNAYRTSLLDFVELYDFVAPKGGNDASEG